LSNSTACSFNDTVKVNNMRKTSFTIEYDQEIDGRWIAEVKELSGVLCYGSTQVEAKAKAEALTLRVLADRLEAGEQIPEPASIEFSSRK